MKISDNRKNILQNLGWSVVGKMTTLTGSLVVGLIVARYLGPERYGLMNYVISVVFLFQTLSVFGLDQIEVREEARAPQDFRSIIGTAFAIRLVLAAIALSAVVAWAWIFEEDAYVSAMICLYALTILCGTLNVVRNYFMAIVQNKYVVKSEITRTLVGMTVKIALYLAGASLTCFIAACAFDFVLLASGYVVAYRRRVGPLSEWRFDARWCRLLLRESFPLLLTTAAVVVYQRIDQVMIGRMVSKESVGYFSTASRFVEVLMYIPMMLAQTISPVLTRIRSRSEQVYAARAQTFMNISVWLSIFAGGLTSILSYWIILLLLGPAYLPAVGVLQVMAFKAASVALSNTAGTMLVVEGLQKWAIFRDLLGCLVCVGLNWILLPRYGIMAAAYVAIASNIAAGWLADLFIPAYRHLFRMQTRALCLGWASLFRLSELRGNPENRETRET